jgi:hypothetical protein
MSPVQHRRLAPFLERISQHPALVAADCCLGRQRPRGDWLVIAADQAIHRSAAAHGLKAPPPPPSQVPLGPHWIDRLQQRLQAGVNISSQVQGRGIQRR